MRKLKTGTYKHFKGGLYKVISFARHTETDEVLVIYKGLTNSIIYARPYDMFNSKVDKEKYPEVEQEYRFEECEVI